MKKKLFIILFLFLFSFAANSEESNLPVCREASFIEQYSETEILLEASGIGKKPSDAELDAKRSAVNFALYDAPNKILVSAQDKQSFNSVSEEIFDENKINNYISWSSDRYTKTPRKLPDKRMKVCKSFRVNVGKLREDLVNMGVIASTKDLAVQMGNPFVSVIAEDDDSSVGQTVIETYLTSKGFNTLSIEQSQKINSLIGVQKDIQGIEDDLTHKFGERAFGSDIYITYSVNETYRNMGGTRLSKVSAAVKAFETSTGQLLGSATGYSDELKVSDTNALIEQAIGRATDEVITKMKTFWKAQVENIWDNSIDAKGINYKMIISFSDIFDKSETREMQRELRKIIKSGGSNGKIYNYKTGGKTHYTVDYTLWSGHRDSQDLFYDIADNFEENFEDVFLDDFYVKGKLLLIKAELE